MEDAAQGVDRPEPGRLVRWLRNLAKRIQESLLFRACTPRNPFLAHELNLIRRDLNFWRMNAAFLLIFWLFFYNAPWILLHIGGWGLEEGFSLIALVLCSVLLGYRLRRPHIRYNGENAVFLCVLPMDGAELIAHQTIAVIFQPILLLLMALPMALLMVGVGMVHAQLLLLKLTLVCWILFITALFGVSRVPRHWQLFLGLPIGFPIMFLAGILLVVMLGDLISSMVVAVAPALDRNQVRDSAIQGLSAIYALLAVPATIFLAAVNPLWTYFAQTTELARILMRGAGTYGATWVAWSQILTSLGAGSAGPGAMQTTALQVSQGLDQVTIFVLLTPMNWAFMVGLTLLYAHDAWMRGADQFEFFRVRGYPTRFRDYRELERERVLSRNSRIRTQRYYRWGQAIERRFGTGATARSLRGLIASFTSPLRREQALQAMALHPEDYKLWKAERDARLAARRRKAAPPAIPVTAGQRQPGHATMTAAPPIAMLPPPPPSMAARPVLSVLPVPAVAAAMPTAGANPAGDAIWDAPPVVVPMPKPQAKPLPKWFEAVFRAPATFFMGLVRLMYRLVPITLRNNPVFAHDWAILRAILLGQREGIWAYSWTVLLTIDVLISSFVYLMWAFSNTLISLLRWAQSGGGIASVETVDLGWVTQSASVYIMALFATLPLVGIALPIYAYLKERGRPDWSSYVLTSQSSSSMLGGKGAIFLILGAVSLLLVPILALVLNPMLLIGWIWHQLNPQLVVWEPRAFAPVWGLLYMTALLGLGAVYYQFFQYMFFVALCFNLKRGSSALGGLVLVVLGGLFFLTVLATTLLGSSNVLENVPIVGAVWQALGDLWRLLWGAVDRLWGFLIEFSSRSLPLTPWSLKNRFWEEGDYGFSRFTVPGALYATLFYWGLALLGHWMSARVFESRLRSEHPRHFEISLIRRRRRTKT